MILYSSILISILVVELNVNVISADICADIHYDCDACSFGNVFECLWCADEVHNDTTRCRLARNPIVTPSWCQNIINPNPSPVIIHDDPENNDFVEVKPQHVTIQARPRKTVEFTMSYKPKLDRPVNIHYIFDNSPTMKMYKEQLEKQLPELKDEFKKFSRDIRFEIANLETKPFDPREHEYINNDSVNKELQEQNESLKNSGLKIVLDGLSLALENYSMLDDFRSIFILFCDPRNAIYVPDASHPRKIDTIVKKVDEIAKRKNIHIIFIGLKDYHEEYITLATKIQGSAYVELQNIPTELENEVDFVKVIKKEYMKLVHTLELDMGDSPPYLTIQLKPPCDPIGRRCTRKVQQGIPLSITATISMLECPSTFKHKETFEIKPIGSQEMCTLDTDILCYCECNDRVEVKSLKCNSMGDYSCGICKCYDGRYGDFCQCIGDWLADGWQQCRSGPDDFWPSGCNGQGDCICGECHCHEGYTGKHCTKQESCCNIT